MRILYQGLLRSPASWARVGRGYLEAMASFGVEIEALRSRGFRHDPSFPLPKSIREISLREALSGPEPDVGLGFLHPPLSKRLMGRLRAELFVWESDVLPEGWASSLSEAADLVAVPSGFTRDALVRSGFDASRVAVIPYGHPWAEAPLRAGRRAPFTILSVVAPHWRKGIRELLTAYGRAFRKGERVLLRLKTTYDPGASRRRKPFEIPSWKRVIEDCGLSAPGAPAIELDARTVGDLEMLDLYLGCDLYVQASWGESFGLALLEAMALGLPAVATAWGGHMDYFAAGADAIPFRLEDAGAFLYERAPGAHVAIPDTEALAERLRWHWEHPEESRALGEQNRKAVASLSWTECAKRLLAALEGAAREGPRRGR